MSAPFHRLMLLELMDTMSGGNQLDTTKTQLAKVDVNFSRCWK